MFIKNTFKIMLSAFSNVWKILLYKTVIILAAFGLIFGLVMPTVFTVLNAISQTGIFENIKNLISAFFSRAEGFSEVVTALKESIEASSITLKNYADRLFITYIILFCIFLFAAIISSLSKLALTDVVNGEMSSVAKYRFMSRFVINLGKSLRLSLLSIFVVYPAYIILAVVVWAVFSFLFNYIGVFALFFAAITFILLLAVVQSFFSGWQPQIIVKGTGIFESIGLSFKCIRKNYFKICGSYVVIDILVLFSNIMLAFFTCGIGLIVSLPVTVLFYTCYRMVLYYELNNLKYYSGSNKMIVDPSVDF